MKNKNRLNGLFLKSHQHVPLSTEIHYSRSTKILCIHCSSKRVCMKPSAGLSLILEQMMGHLAENQET